MSYTLTGPSLNTYSRRRSPFARLTTGVGSDSAGREELARSKATTDTRSLAPTSRTPSRYVEALAPPMLVHRSPARSQRSHAKLYEAGGGAHDPGAALRRWPACSIPKMLGARNWRGAVRAASEECEPLPQPPVLNTAPRPATTSASAARTRSLLSNRELFTPSAIILQRG